MWRSDLWMLRINKHNNTTSHSPSRLQKPGSESSHSHFGWDNDLLADRCRKFQWLRFFFYARYRLNLGQPKPSQKIVPLPKNRIFLSNMWMWNLSKKEIQDWIELKEWEFVKQENGKPRLASKAWLQKYIFSNIDMRFSSHIFLLNCMSGYWGRLKESTILKVHVRINCTL